MVEQVKSFANASAYVDYAGLVMGARKREVLATCRAMLAPSVWKEPLGLVTYEAQEAGRAMFAANSGGLAETTVHDETGFIHEAGNVIQLADQIEEYQLWSAEERNALGMRARTKLLSEASPDKWK